jgi:hypothetical protein
MNSDTVGRAPVLVSVSKERILPTSSITTTATGTANSSWGLRMTFHLGLGLDAIVTICGLSIFVAVTTIVLFMKGGGRSGVDRWRPAILVVVADAILGLTAESLTTALRVPVVRMDGEGLWCAPWPAPVAWENIDSAERIYFWLGGNGDEPEDPVMDLKLVLKNPNAAAAGPSPWQDVEQAWMRDVLRVWRRSSSAWFDSLREVGDPARVYCHVSSLADDVDVSEQAERFIAQSVQARTQREYEQMKLAQDSNSISAISASRPVADR